MIKFQRRDDDRSAAGFQTRASVFVVARRPVRSAPRGRGVARAHDRYFARDDGLDRRRAGGRSAVVRGRGRGRGVRARSRRVVRRAVQGAAGEKDPRGPLRGGPAAVPPRRPGRLHGPLRRRSPGGRASRSRASPVPSSRGISRPPPRPPPASSPPRRSPSHRVARRVPAFRLADRRARASPARALTLAPPSPTPARAQGWRVDMKMRVNGATHGTYDVVRPLAETSNPATPDPPALAALAPAAHRRSDASGGASSSSSSS